MAAEWICDGCGKRAPGTPTRMGDWRKPADWYERTHYANAEGKEPALFARYGDFKGILTACSRRCIDRIAEKTNTHGVVLPVLTRPTEPRTCQRCGKRIVWHETEAGYHQALDPDPNPRGNVVLVRARAADSEIELGAQMAITVSKSRQFEGSPRYMPHQATCAAQERAR